MLRDARARAGTALVALLAAYAGLVLTHRGEFWPFSVFPMYSTGRSAWSRPVLREVSGAGPAPWQVVDLAHLPGRPFSLFEAGVQRAALRRAFRTPWEWEAEGIASLRSLVGEEGIRGRRLLLFDVRGTLAAVDGVDVECVPLALFTEEATLVNPAFRDS
jgi:hypothetical protein